MREASRAEQRAPGIVGLAGVMILTLAAGFALGALIGVVAGKVWVFGAFGVLGGLAVGAAATFAETLFIGRPSRAVAIATSIAAIGALFLAFGVWQAFEDAHQRRAFAVDLARSRAADTGLAPDELARAFDTDPDASVDFLARDADVMLDEAMRTATGLDGFAGRFMGRHAGGFRLASAGTRQFGLPVPAWVAVGGTLADLAIALWVLRRVRRSVRRPR